jgi:hypothetical protein
MTSTSFRRARSCGGYEEIESMANKETVICSPPRTAIGTYGGTLKDIPAVDLGAVVVGATNERAKP